VTGHSPTHGPRLRQHKPSPLATHPHPTEARTYITSSSSHFLSVRHSNAIHTHATHRQYPIARYIRKLSAPTIRLVHPNEPVSAIILSFMALPLTAIHRTSIRYSTLPVYWHIYLLALPLLPPSDPPSIPLCALARAIDRIGDVLRVGYKGTRLPVDARYRVGTPLSFIGPLIAKSLCRYILFSRTRSLSVHACRTALHTQHQIIKNRKFVISLIALDI
jgi:hypothetical protein